MSLPEGFALRMARCLRCERSGKARQQCEVSGLTLHDHAMGTDCPENRPLFKPVPVLVGWPAPYPIPDDYEATPENATRGRCCS